MHLHDIASANLNSETAVGGIGAWKQVCAIVLKFRNFRDILRYLENLWRYLENFWRYLELFSRIFRKIFRPNLGIFVSEPSQRPCYPCQRMR